MRSSQNRFEKAFKKLQEEVQHKTARTISEKSRNSQLPENDFSNPKPKPPVKTSKKKARKFKTTLGRVMKNNEVMPPEIEKYNPSNPRLFNQTMRASQAGPLAARPKEVGPVVTWDQPVDRVDMNEIEKMLQVETIKSHKLVLPPKIKVKSEIKDKLPLDYFDCFNGISNDEQRVMNGEKNIMAKTKIIEAGKEVWHKCKIIKYKPESHTFMISIPGMKSIFNPARALVKEVSRFNIKFNDDNEKNFAERLKLAEKLRNDFENSIRTDEFLDNLDDDNYLSFIRPEFRAKMPKDALIVAERVQKMFAVRGEVQVDDIDDAVDILNSVGADLSRYTPKQLKYPLLIHTKFAHNLDVIQKLPLSYSVNIYLKALQQTQLMILNDKETIIYKLNEFVSNKKLLINEWLPLIAEFKIWLNKFMEGFSDNIAKMIIVSLAAVIDTLGDANITATASLHPYFQFTTPESSVFHRFLRRVQFMVREMILDVIDYNKNYFAKLFTHNWKTLETEHVTLDGFTTLSPSISDINITNLKPIFLIDLGNEVSEMENVLKELYSIIPDVISKIINPASVIFERSSSAEMHIIKESAFQIYMKRNHLEHLIPPVFAVKQDFMQEYLTPYKELIDELIIDHVNHVNEAFPIMQKETGDIFDFFETDYIPKIDDTYKFITRLIPQKDFFLHYFPSFINLGLFELNFNDFKNTIFECVEKKKVLVLDLVSQDLQTKIAQLNGKYESVLKLFKKEITTPEQWAARKAVLDDLPETRKQLGIEAENIMKLYDLLFNLYYGLDSNTVTNILNIKFWPLLIDIELGQAITIATTVGREYIENMPNMIEQLKAEQVKTQEDLANEKNFVVKEQKTEYLKHLEQKIIRIQEIDKQLKESNENMIEEEPRVKLWKVITFYQEMLKKWSVIPIKQLNINQIKDDINGWLLTLRKLTKEFAKDHNSMKSLIFVKNDLERLLPIFKMVAQILSDKIKAHHRKTLEDIIGRKDFENMTLTDFNETNIIEKIPRITELYNISKGEDKADLELINVRDTINGMKIKIDENNYISNAEQMMSDLKYNQGILKNIIYGVQLKDTKNDLAVKMHAKIVRMMRCLDKFISLQEHIKLLNPLSSYEIDKQIRSAMSEQLHSLNQLKNDWITFILEIQQDPLLIKFCDNSDYVTALKETESSAVGLRSEFIDVIISFRNISPRMALIPDVKIVETFSDNIDVKLMVLSIMFQGIEEWVVNNGNLNGLVLESGDTLTFDQEINLLVPLISQVPKIESMIISTMKNLFFKFLNNEISMPILPLQLKILAVINNPDLDIDNLQISDQQRKILISYKQTLINVQKPIHLNVDKAKQTVTIISGSVSIDYCFQVSSVNTAMFSPILHETFCNIIEKINIGNPILIHSALSAVSVLSVKLFCYVSGRSLLLLHSTKTMSIFRIPQLINSLSTINVFVCIDEIQIMKQIQLFDFSKCKTNKPFFCTATTLFVSDLVKTMCSIIFIDKDDYNKHLENIGNTLFPAQSSDVNFAVSKLTQYMHPYLIQQYFDYSFENSRGKLKFNFLSNFKQVVPEQLIKESNITIEEMMMKTPKKTLNVGKNMLQTKAFKYNFDKITELINTKQRVFLMSGPPFSGTSTVIEAATLSLGLEYFYIAFTSESWVNVLTAMLVQTSDKKCVFHLLVPFANPFLYHSTSVIENSMVCEGLNSLMSIGSNTIIIFELMEPVVNASQISIPIISFTQPLVTFSDLLNYWLINDNVQFDEQMQETVRNIANELISTPLQLQSFFKIFACFCNTYRPETTNSLYIILGLSIFWSKSKYLETEDEYRQYSKQIKTSLQIEHLFKKDIIDYSYKTTFKPLEIYEIKKSHDLAIVDETLLDKYAATYCGPIEFTNIPCMQFLHAVKNLTIMLQNKVSCFLQGPTGSGKTTILNYICDTAFIEPNFSSVRVNGNAITLEWFIDMISSISTISVEDIIEPTLKIPTLIVFDPIPNKDTDLYGFILSMIKCKSIIINNNVVKLHNFIFLLTGDSCEHQIEDAVFMFKIPKYQLIDMKMISHEIIARSILIRHDPQANKMISKAIQNFDSVLEECFELIPKYGNLHLLCLLARKVINFKDPTSDGYVTYLQYNLNRLIPEYHKDSFLNPKFMMTTSNDTDYFITNQEDPKFTQFVQAKLHENFDEIALSDDGNLFLSYVIHCLTTPYSHPLVVDDMRCDYEYIVELGCQIMNAKLLRYSSSDNLWQLVLNAITASEIYVLFMRNPVENLLEMIYDKLKNSMLEHIIKMMSMKSLNEAVTSSLFSVCKFPFAGLISQEAAKFDADNEAENKQQGPGIKAAQSKMKFKINDQRTSTRLQLSFSNRSSTFLLKNTPSKQNYTVRGSAFRYVAMHMFRKLHFVTFISERSQIDQKRIYSFNLWDRSNIMPDVDVSLLKLIFNFMKTGKTKYFVPIHTQFNRIIQKYNFLTKKVQEFIVQRKKFTTKVLSIISSIETAIKDNEALVLSITSQIEIDKTFLQNHIEAIEFRTQFLTSLEKEKVRCEKELEELKEREKLYDEYKKNDSQVTFANYQAVTKIAAKAFIQDEQYKLYIQQNPPEPVRHLFNTFCALHELTPRSDGDYWSEARGYLRVGRFNKVLLVFDPNTVRKDVALQLDVRMKDPLLVEEKFQKDSCCLSLLHWLQAVLTHTKSTKFEATVQIQMDEHTKTIERRTEEYEKILRRIEEAKEDLEMHKKGRDEVKQKLAKEEAMLKKKSDFLTKAKTTAKFFPDIKEDLSKFINGEKVYAKNQIPFLVKSTTEIACLPLIPGPQRKKFIAGIDGIFNDSLTDPTFFISLKNVFGTEDPLIISLISGDRLICCYDPHGTEFSIVGGDTGQAAPTLQRRFTFTYTDTSSKKFIEDIKTAASNGNILVIKHANQETLDNQFLTCLASKSARKGVIDNREVVIDINFRVIFFVDKPLKYIPTGITFIHCNTIHLEKIESVILNNNNTIDILEKLTKTEQISHGQREGLYNSIQSLETEMERLHSADGTVLDDVQLQSIVMMNTEKRYQETKVLYEKSIEENKIVCETATKIQQFITDIQNTYEHSSLYLFPFEKITRMINSCPENENKFTFVQKQICATFAQHHRWGIKQLSGVKPGEFIPGKFNILHFNEIAQAAEFYIQKVHSDVVLNIEENSDIKNYFSKLDDCVLTGKTVYFIFFNENKKFYQQLSEFLIQNPTNTWQETSKLFLLVETSYNIPPRLVIESEICFIDI